MHSPFVPPRQVKIGDAAAFAGTTPRAIRHYHEIGLLPEPERGGDDHRRYGYEDMIRLLWIRKTAGAGIALDDIRDAFAIGTASDGGDGIAGILERLETTLAEQEAESRRQRIAVRRMRTEGSRMGLLSDLVTDRLESLPEGSLRQAVGLVRRAGTVLVVGVPPRDASLPMPVIQDWEIRVQGCAAYTEADVATALAIAAAGEIPTAEIVTGRVGLDDAAQAFAAASADSSGKVLIDVRG